MGRNKSEAKKAKQLRRIERNFLKKLEVRRNLFIMQGGVCFLCEKPFSLRAPATIEHLVPKSLGGSGRFDNLALTHEKCNHRRETASWIAAVVYFTNESIRRYWRRYIVSGYRPRLQKLSLTNPV